MRVIAGVYMAERKRDIANIPVRKEVLTACKRSQCLVCTPVEFSQYNELIINNKT